MADDDSALAAHTLERLARLVRAGDYAGGLNPAQREALRYLARANRFSDSPGALTNYLGATKGTISQTIKALIAKGLVEKKQRAGARNSVALSLTAQGHALLGDDAWVQFARTLKETLKGKTRQRLAKILDRLLSDACVRQGVAGFGVCATCRAFRENGRSLDPAGPHLCMVFEVALSKAQSRQICVAHTPRNIP